MRLAKLEELSEEEPTVEARSLKTLTPLKLHGTKFNTMSLGGLLRRIFAEFFFMGSIQILGLRHAQLDMFVDSSILQGNLRRIPIGSINRRKRRKGPILMGMPHLLNWRGAIEDDNVSTVLKTRCENESQQRPPIVGRSYRDMVNQNNPHPNFNLRMNTVWEAHGDNGDLGVSVDDMSEEDDPTSPTICLTAKEKRRIHPPWKYALIIKMFDMRIDLNIETDERIGTNFEILLIEEHILEESASSHDKENFPNRFNSQNPSDRNQSLDNQGTDNSKGMGQAHMQKIGPYMTTSLHAPPLDQGVLCQGITLERHLQAQIISYQERLAPLGLIVGLSEVNPNYREEELGRRHSTMNSTNFSQGHNHSNGEAITTFAHCEDPHDKGQPQFVPEH
ncbi:hypothetical protein Cgig2_009922 [Carnegiea gigantea]|uniref:Uncharacterized protein n=1 Tax=Carnegiea gigantea TaxID=171969 RepID=A0A9Q1K493_9CARY|nr:hypothetical protein Cgig2_009922 [Carnegiea gigantea]